MTIIAAYRDDTRHEVWIGSDSRVCSEKFIWPEIARKIVKCGKWTIGCSGSSMSKRIVEEMRDLIAGAETPEAIAKILFQEFRERGYKAHDHDGPTCYGQTFVVCSKDDAWMIADAGIASRADHGFIATGSGDEFAFGAWHALRSADDLHAATLVQMALEAACFFDSGCGGDLIVERVE